MNSFFFLLYSFSALIHEKSVGAMLSSKDSEFERLTKENMVTIASYGENLMQVVCRDACDGHNVGRVRNENFIPKTAIFLVRDECF